MKAGKPGTVKRVRLGNVADLSTGVKVKALSVTSMMTKAETPGEIAGPALAIKVRLTNDSDATINVDSAIVTLTDAKGNPAQPTTSDPFKPIAGELSVGASKTGSYVFLVPKGKRKDLVLRVEYLAGQPIADFVGDAT